MWPMGYCTIFSPWYSKYGNADSEWQFGEAEMGNSEDLE